MNPQEILTDPEMEHKFQECNMEQKLKACTAKRVPRDSYHNPVKNKREYIIVHLNDNGETEAIICHFEGPDGESFRSIRLMVSDGITYIQRGIV